VSTSTVKNYFQILEDTLIGFKLKGYSKTKKRKAVSRIKHYLFDIGVANSLAKRWVEDASSAHFGPAFEHFIALELRAYLSYSQSDALLGYWRTTSQMEVDFTIGDTVAVEVKSTSAASERHCSGLLALKEENLFQRYILVSRDEKRRMTSQGIEILPYQIFLEELWAGSIV
jgi:predicted AAA+ superfamily ATPase